MWVVGATMQTRAARPSESIRCATCRPNVVFPAAGVAEARKERWGWASTAATASSCHARRGRPAGHAGSVRTGINGGSSLRAARSERRGPRPAAARGVPSPPVTAPTGADAVIPQPARFGALRLAWLRALARGGPGVEGRVTLARGAAVRVADGAEVVLGDGVHLGTGCRVEALSGSLRIGPRTLVGPRAFVIALDGLEIGPDCGIGALAGGGGEGAAGARGPVRIGARARVAAHATVASGATVAPGTVVPSYGAVV